MIVTGRQPEPRRRPSRVRRDVEHRRSEIVPINTRFLVAAVATATATVGVAPSPSSSVEAATPACGPGCISIFSRALGTYDQPNVVETVLGGVAQVGQPVILSPASSADPSQDLMPRPGLVSQFHAAGMVSDDVDHHYGDLRAAQIEYSPHGDRTGLCVGLASAAHQNQGLTLQPCTTPGTTVWIIDTADSPGTISDGFFPLVNGSTTNFTHPFAMELPRSADLGDPTRSQIRVRRLQFVGRDHTPPERQLWGTLVGVLM